MKVFFGMILGIILTTGFFLIYPDFNKGYHSVAALDKSTIYEVKGSDLAKNYANPSYYTDKIFNISLKIDHIATGDGYIDIQYHGGIEYGARVDIILTIEQAKKYNIQKGTIVKFENVVWNKNKQMQNNSGFGGATHMWEVISFREY